MPKATRLDRFQNEKLPTAASVTPASKLPIPTPRPTGPTRNASNLIQRIIAARRR